MHAGALFGHAVAEGILAALVRRTVGQLVEVADLDGCAERGAAVSRFRDQHLDVVVDADRRHGCPCSAAFRQGDRVVAAPNVVIADVVNGHGVVVGPDYVERAVGRGEWLRE